MQLNNYRTSAAGDKGVIFPRLECWNPMTKVATVAAEVNKQRVLCRISLGSLKSRFGASEDAPMLAVAKHRATIQEAARRLIENAHYEKDGSVLIRARDL